MRTKKPLRTALMKTKFLIKKLLTHFPGRFSKQLGIDLSQGSSEEIFKWFLAAKLYGAPISADIAARTYEQFVLHNLTSPEKILSSGWNKLVEILDQGGYVRYDFSTASRLLEICQNLISQYKGDLNQLQAKAADKADLENRLRLLGKGMGPVTIQIFLREMRFLWPKAQPGLSKAAQQAALNLGLIKDKNKALSKLQSLWESCGFKISDFPDLEAALVRLGLKFCPRFQCSLCPLQQECPSARISAGKGSSRQQLS